MKITRRTFAIAVRVLAVLAAIYTFFTFRSQLAERRSSQGGGAIPAQVVSRERPCGWLAVMKGSSSSADSKISLEKNQALRAAIQKPGERVAVRNEEECGRLIKLNGSIISADKATFKINFSQEPFNEPRTKSQGSIFSLLP